MEVVFMKKLSVILAMVVLVMIFSLVGQNKLGAQVYGQNAQRSQQQTDQTLDQLGQTLNNALTNGSSNTSSNNNSTATATCGNYNTYITVSYAFATDSNQYIGNLANSNMTQAVNIVVCPIVNGAIQLNSAHTVFLAGGGSVVDNSFSGLSRYSISGVEFFAGDSNCTSSDTSSVSNYAMADFRP